jgi:hypothetical protein
MQTRRTGRTPAVPDTAGQPDHEIEGLEYDPTVPPRPEEEVADAGREDRHQPDGADARP